MSGRDEEIVVPRGALLGAGALAAFVIAVAALSAGGAPPPSPPAAETRRLLFEEDGDGGLVVRATDGAVLDRLAIQGDSFAITAALSVAGRVGAGADPEPRFALDLRREAEGALALVDPATGRRLPLRGFGPDNAAALAHWLEDAPR